MQNVFIHTFMGIMSQGHMWLLVRVGPRSREFDKGRKLGEGSVQSFIS